MKTDFIPDGPDKDSVVTPADVDVAFKVEPKARTYAASLFSLAKAEGRIGEVDNDLQLVVATVSGHLKLKDSLGNPQLSVTRKQAIAAEVFENKVSPLTLSYVDLLVRMELVDSLPALAEAYTALMQVEERKTVAEVTTAVPISKEFMVKLADRLSTMTGKDVKVRHRVDPSIVGGVVVRMDGRLLDGSVRHQLDVLKERLSHTEMRGRQANDATATD